MYKILVCDPLSETAIRILNEAPDVEFTEMFGLDENQLAEKVTAYNAIIIRSATQVTKKIIDKADNLKVIGRAGSGLDNVDVAYAKSKGIKILNTPGTNAPAVAELTIGMLFNLARKIPAANQSMKAGKWEKKAFGGIELSGKVLGIIGCGGIGKLVAEKAEALGMDVLIYNRSKIQLESVTFQQVSLEKLYTASDFITIHLPKAKNTTHFIGAKQFGKMKKNARLVNTSRGGIVDEAALLDALNSAAIAGAALDVYENEPEVNMDLVKHAQVIATPHIGASSAESQERVGILIMDRVLEFLRSKYMFF